MTRKPRPSTAPLLFGAFALAVFTLTRLVLALIAGREAVPLADWPLLFAKGLWFIASC